MRRRSRRPRLAGRPIFLIEAAASGCDGPQRRFEASSGAGLPSRLRRSHILATARKLALPLYLPRPACLPYSHISNRRARRCLNRARRQGRARFAGRALARASLDPCARLRLLVSMDFGETSRPAGRLRSPKSMETKRRIGAAQSPRSGRSAAQPPRSGLTATGRCGREPEMLNVVAPRRERLGEGLGDWRQASRIARRAPLDALWRALPRRMALRASAPMRKDGAAGEWPEAKQEIGACRRGPQYRNLAASLRRTPPP